MFNYQTMYWILYVVILLRQAGFLMAYNTTEEYLKHCRPSNCGESKIKFPLSLDSSPSYCSPQGIMQLSCSANSTLHFYLPMVGNVEVIHIDYLNSQYVYYDDIAFTLTIKLNDSWAACPLQKLVSTNFTSSDYYYYYPSSRTVLALLNCSRKLALHEDTRIAGPIPCLSNSHGFVYAADSTEQMEKMPTECEMKQLGGEFPYEYGQSSISWQKAVNDFIETRRMIFYCSSAVDISYKCRRCEASGMQCVYYKKHNIVNCSDSDIPKGLHSHVKDITICASVGVLLLLIIVAGIMLYIVKKSYREKEVRLKVEKFLETYHGHQPTRYTFKEVKTITKRFKNKLGQGGYGSVYKGELRNGIPVAIKMLEKLKGRGEEFINEVSTIGRIHHVNIVRLLGFCSEGSRRALVYEFMANESLEKYIFSREVNQGKSKFSVEQLLDIAIGIARGIEYLHQGCNQRILHFDIKPHNILLDYDFKPKIADFGLAKLCSKEQSIVTMTAARGTMGYIAPELYSRNFGTVSYKSDVYSFGMLLLEMIGGRKNLDPDIQNQSQIYFPEWVYDQVVTKKEPGIIANMEENEEESAKKLALVALWCIQWSPMDRPTMTRVLQMLIESSENLQVPPKPFVSGDEHNET